MSRSYKHSPVYTDGSPHTTKEMKRIANKRVRKYKKNIPNGKSYKHLFCSYDIHDYISRWSWVQARKDYEADEYYRWHEKYPTIEEFYRYWRKYYRNK